MFDVRIRLEADRLFKKLTCLQDELIPYAVASFEHFAELARIMLMQRTPRSPAGNEHIADLWVYQKTRMETMTAYIVYNLTPMQDVLTYLEYGTSAHRIPTSGNTLLHWIDPESGEDRFAMNVWHPGTIAYKMVDITRYDIQNKMDEYIDETLATVVRAFKQGAFRGAQ